MSKTSHPSDRIGDAVISPISFPLPGNTARNISAGILIAALFFILPLLFFPQTALASPLTAGEPKTITIENEQYIELPLEIAGGGYIYANPKGPGIGRPVEFFSDEIEEIFLPKPQSYQPAQGDYVNIYRGEIFLLIPAKSSKSTEEITIELRGLYCTDTSCEEVSLRTTVSAEGRAAADSRRLQDLVRVEVSDPPAAVSESKKSDGLAALEFTPRIIASSEVSSLLPALLFGLLAGLLLNFMPCVLPVISLKLMSLVRHASSRRQSILSGIAYSVGILSSFTALAILSSAAGKNWGSLFQSSLFLSFSAVLIVSLALSYFGLYPLPQLSLSMKRNSDNIYAASFLQGLFATLLATPCSGPFLGAVLAWALAQKTAIIFSVFIAIGCGMALPFLVLSAFPSLTARLPKGGSWQGALEKGAGFLLLASALYFIHLLRGSAILFTLSAVFVCSLILALYGNFALRLRGFLSKAAPVLTVSLLIAAFFTLNILYSSDEAVVLPDYSHKYLTQHRDEVIAVIFTADWCPNCRTVEATVFTPGMHAILKEKGVTLMKADLTLPDSPGEDLLRRLGSRSIPFLAVFPKGAEGLLSPVCLRDIYTRKDFLTALEEAGITEAGAESPVGSDKATPAIQLDGF